MMSSPSQLYKAYSNQGHLQSNFSSQLRQLPYPPSYASLLQGQPITSTQAQHLLSAYSTRVPTTYPERATSQSVRPMPIKTERVTEARGLELLHVASLHAEKESQGSSGGPPSFGAPTSSAPPLMKVAVGDSKSIPPPKKKKRTYKPRGQNTEGLNINGKKGRVYVDEVREWDILCGRGKHIVGI